MKNIFKKSLSLFLALLIICSIAPTNIVTHANASDDKITWSFDGETLTVSGSGELSSSYTSTDEWKNMQDKCINACIEGEITVIGKNAFRDFTALKKVEISSQIKTVGEYAFSGCTQLIEINLPDSITEIDIYAFADCVSIKNLEIPKNIIRINEWAFKNCTCFDGKALILPDTLKKVALGAFSGANIKSLTAPFVGVGPYEWEEGDATYHLGYIFGDEQFNDTYRCGIDVPRSRYYIPNSLKEVTITKYLYFSNFENFPKIEKIVIKDTVETTYYPADFVKNCTSLKEFIVENPDIITSIDSRAFKNCTSLESFTIPKNVTRIGAEAFYGCKFQAIALPQNLQKIENGAFYNCVFDSIAIPNTVTSIGANAFGNCKKIQTVVIPDSVTTIGDYAFKGCSNLKYVKLPTNIESMGAGVFDGTQYTGEAAEDFIITENGVLVQYLGTDTNVVVPAGVTRIGAAFAGRTDIKNITLPEGLLYISNDSFKDCSGLTELVIPGTVLEIENRAFDGCSHITELVIPESVQEIHEGALAGLCNLHKLTVPFIGQNRDVQSNTRESLLGHWFSSSNDHDCIYNCSVYYVEIKQTYNNDNNFKRVYKPVCFTDLTVTGSILKSNSLKNFRLESLTLGENVQGIEEYAADKSGIKELHFDENIKITEIPDYAFCNNNLTTINIPNSVKRIGVAFICDYYPDNKITEINLNEGLEIIDGSFAGSKITSIDFPDSLIKILDKSFRNCTKLEYIEFPENLTTIGKFAFEYSALKEVVFSESISKIGCGAFWDCPITRVVVPESVQSVVEETFRYCDELEIVVIGGNVTEIGAEAFADCTSLEAIVIPDSVVSISDDTFKNTSENLVIYCNEGSYAQQYATKNNIKYTTLVLDAVPNQTYTGKALEPAVNAKANGKQLVLNTEYKLSYSNNIEVGVADIIARGLGDFKHLVAKAQFNILQRRLNTVTLNYTDYTYYSPVGITLDLLLYVGDKPLEEGVDYDIIGTDNISGVGIYNISIVGKNNFSGTKNLTLEVLPRSITEVKLVSRENITLTDSKYTLIEGVDYKVQTRTTQTGETETYVVGIGNYTDERVIRSSGGSDGDNIFLRLFALLENFFAMILGIFK